MDVYIFILHRLIANYVTRNTVSQGILNQRKSASSILEKEHAVYSTNVMIFHLSSMGTELKF